MSSKFLFFVWWSKYLTLSLSLSLFFPCDGLRVIVITTDWGGSTEFTKPIHSSSHNSSHIGSHSYTHHSSTSHLHTAVKVQGQDGCASPAGPLLGSIPRRASVSESCMASRAAELELLKEEDEEGVNAQSNGKELNLEETKRKLSFTVVHLSSSELNGGETLPLLPLTHTSSRHNSAERKPRVCPSISSTSSSSNFHSTGSSGGGIHLPSILTGPSLTASGSSSPPSLYAASSAVDGPLMRQLTSPSSSSSIRIHTHTEDSDEDSDRDQVRDDENIIE